MVAQNEAPTQGHKADLLFVTVTEVEARALNVFSPYGSTFEQCYIDDNIYFDLGVIGERELLWCMVQSEMGAGGPAGATLVTYEGIKALSLSAVIMVGIAFGLIPEKQYLGDILVSRQLAGYEL